MIQLGAYNSSISFGNFKLKFGVDAGSVFPFLARELGVSEAALLSGARFRRVAMRRRLPAATLPKIEINAETLRASAVGAGRYLARAVGSDGKFRYEVDGEDLFWWGIRTPGGQQRLASAVHGVV